MKHSFLRLHLAATGIAFLALAAPGGPEAQAAKLTCTFIAKQCVKECRKEVEGSFCNAYCGEKRQECLGSGNWFGLSRTFRNVIRK